MSFKVAEGLQPILAFTSTEVPAAEDVFNGDPTSDVLSMANHRSMMLVITKYAGATGTAVVTVESCDDTTPTTATPVAFRYRVITGTTPGAWTAATSAGFTTTAGANNSFQIAVLSEGLSGTDKFVRFVCTEGVDSPCDGALQVFAMESRFEFDGGFDLTS